jgi:hypothetical protein
MAHVSKVPVVASADEIDERPTSFYRNLGGGEFETTPATTSPWDVTLQHGGPPSALLARTIEQVPSDAGLTVARFSVDFFGGVPQGRLTAEARVIRPGRRIELVEASLRAADRVVAVARAWRIKPSAEVSGAVVVAPAIALPGEQPERAIASTDISWEYGRAIEWRFGPADPSEPGRARVWTRIKIPLIEGEQPTGLQRILTVADSINGLSAVLDLREWLFVPPGLTLHAHRLDAGEWLLLDAVTIIDNSGIGVAHGTVADERGQLGLVAQPLLVQRLAG